MGSMSRNGIYESMHNLRASCSATVVQDLITGGHRNTQQILQQTYHNLGSWRDCLLPAKSKNSARAGELLSVQRFPRIRSEHCLVGRLDLLTGHLGLLGSHPRKLCAHPLEGCDPVAGLSSFDRSHPPVAWQICVNLRLEGQVLTHLKAPSGTRNPVWRLRAANSFFRK